MTDLLLDPEELANRLRAARALAGIDQATLGTLGHESHRLGVEDVGRLERPSGPKKPPEFSLKHQQAYAQHTGVPPEWFTEQKLDRIFTSDRLLRLEERLEEERQAMDDLLGALALLLAAEGEADAAQRFAREVQRLLETRPEGWRNG